MKFDISPRGSGKTTRALDWLSQEDNRLLVTHSAPEAFRIQNLVRLKGNQRIAYYRSVMSGQWLRSFRHPQVEIWVDNLDLILNREARGAIVYQVSVGKPDSLAFAWATSSFDHIIVVPTREDKFRLLDQRLNGIHFQSVEEWDEIKHYYQPTLERKLLWIFEVEKIASMILGVFEIAGVSMTSGYHQGNPS